MRSGSIYLRFTLSYRDVEELLAERGIDVSYETVRRWVLKFGPLIARRLRQRRPQPSKRRHLDEMVVGIASRRMYLWRAVDDEGEILDMLVERRRDTCAALRLMRKLLKKQGFAPKLLVTDKLRSYSSALSVGAGALVCVGSAAGAKAHSGCGASSMRYRWRCGSSSLLRQSSPCGTLYYRGRAYPFKLGRWGKLGWHSAAVFE